MSKQNVALKLFLKDKKKILWGDSPESTFQKTAYNIALDEVLDFVILMENGDITEDFMEHLRLKVE